MSLTKKRYDNRIQNLSNRVRKHDRQELKSFKKEKITNFNNKDVFEMIDDTDKRYIKSNQYDLYNYKKVLR